MHEPAIARLDSDLAEEAHKIRRRALPRKAGPPALLCMGQAVSPSVSQILSMSTYRVTADACRTRGQAPAGQTAWARVNPETNGRHPPTTDRRLAQLALQVLAPIVFVLVVFDDSSCRGLLGARRCGCSLGIRRCGRLGEGAERMLEHG